MTRGQWSFRFTITDSDRQKTDTNRLDSQISGRYF